MNWLTYSSDVSLASGKKLAAIAPSIVVDLTPSASSVFASPPTDPAIQVNLLTRSSDSAALKISAVTSVVPNRTTTGLPGIALNPVRSALARASVIELVGYKVVEAIVSPPALKPLTPSTPNSSSCATKATACPANFSLMNLDIIFASMA